MRVGGLVLAAGAGTRFGGPKALAPWGAGTLAGHAVETLVTGGCDEVLVAVGAAADAVRAALPPSAHAVPVPGWPEGIGASLRAGLAAAASRQLAAVVVLPVDAPLVGPVAVRRLLDARPDAPGIVLVTSYRGRRGHPVLLPAGCWPAVSRAATGDTGARGWIRAHEPQVRTIDGDGTGRPDDADTAAALQRLWALRLE